MNIIPAGMFKREVPVEDQEPKKRAEKWCKRCGRKHNPAIRCKALRKVKDLTVVHPCEFCGRKHTEADEECPLFSKKGTQVGLFTTRAKETDATDETDRD